MMRVDVQFEEALACVLPLDLPHRDRLIDKAAQHLQLVAAANESMNLTRITCPTEAAIKHIFDSVAPWQHFRDAARILDAGSGAGFPGIPLSIVLPEIRFTLAESIQKKARFLDATVESLELPNVHVVAQRAEERAAAGRPDIITARALAPVHRIIDLFRKELKRGAQLILYKGPDAERELAETPTKGVHAEIICRYQLPNDLGTRTVVVIRAQRAARAAL